MLQLSARLYMIDSGLDHAHDTSDQGATQEMKTFARQNKTHGRGAPQTPRTSDAGVDHKSVISSLLEAVLVVSPERGVQIANPAARELLGLDARHLNLGGGLAGVLRLTDTEGSPLTPGSYPDRIVARTGHPVSGMHVGYTLADGARMQLKCNAVLIDGTADEDPSIAVSIRDVTEKFASWKRLEYAASHDVMTGLLNRTAVDHQLAVVLGERRADRRALGVMFVDLDQMKRVNDTLGHADGDRALISVARRLQALIPRPGFVGRLGGDEFVAVVDCGDQAGMHRISRSIHDIFTDPVEVRGRRLSITASVGFVRIGRHDTRSAAEVIADADAAMYVAKESGGGRTVDFASLGREGIRSIGA